MQCGLSKQTNVSISVIIPVYNESSTIAVIIERVIEQAEAHGWDLQLVVVDDGSTDATVDLLHSLKQKQSIEVCFHEENRGKGAAIRTALTVVTQELVVIQDADLEYNPADISLLIDEMTHSGADAVFGSRVLCSKVGRAPRRWNRFAVAVTLLNWLVRFVYQLRITDEATCYKLFRANDLRAMDLQCERFEFCPEVVAKAARLNLVVSEVPISYTPRSTSEGKKIRFVDALTAFRTLWKYRNWYG